MYIRVSFSCLLFPSFLGRLSAEPPVPPDGWWCSPRLGFQHVALTQCINALQRMPSGDFQIHYTTNPRISRFIGWSPVPLRYADNDLMPECEIIIDLQGHSRQRTFMSFTRSEVRSLAEELLEKCLAVNQGGVRTIGLGDTLNDILVSPTNFDDGALIDIWGNNEVTPAPQPDRTGNQAAWEGAGVIFPSGGYDVPVYMTITISGRFRRDPEESDRPVSQLLTTYLITNYIGKGGTIPIQDQAATILRGIMTTAGRSLVDPNARWWEFPVPSATPRPENVQYECETTLGVPNLANCEGALFQYIQSGNIDIEPGQPVIKTAGNCAISTIAGQKTTTSWDVLRKVAEYLVAICVSNPIHARRGGLATTKAITSHGKRQSANAGTTMPSSLEVAVYYQSAFAGTPNSTCAYSIVSNHTSGGDVRQCPANSEPPLIPPSRSLLDAYVNTTLNVSAMAAAGLPLSAVTPWLPPASLVAREGNAGRVVDVAAVLNTLSVASSPGGQQSLQISSTGGFTQNTAAAATSPSAAAVIPGSPAYSAEANVGGADCEIAC